MQLCTYTLRYTYTHTEIPLSNIEGVVGATIYITQFFFSHSNNLHNSFLFVSFFYF